VKAKIEDKALYTLDDITAMGGPSKATLRREIEKGNLLAVHLSDRCIRITRSDWQDYVANARTTRAA
jgi:hypothetical protein